MQATLGAAALKPFIRALTCLSRYGDELLLYADAQHFTLSATNSSLSAYCRFRYGKMFFSKYQVGAGVNGAGPSTPEPQDVRGQLLVKTLLSIFKHRTLEKTVERCELVITDGLSSDQSQEDEDTLESRLIVRLHCKHGIVKTHRLPLLTPTSLLSPGVPESDNESRLTIGPKAIKDITEHFPSGRGLKNDPQLVWTFGDTDVDVKSLESSIDTKGRAQLATELTISSDEFDVYDIAEPPVTIAFHMREFNATITYAETMASALELRFTDPAAPLFIDIEGDESDGLFVISTSQLQGATTSSNLNARSSSTPNSQQFGGQKRPHSDNEIQQGPNASGSGGARGETPRMEKVKKPMKAVQRTELPAVRSLTRENSTVVKDEHMMPPPTFIPDANRTQRSPSLPFHASQSEDFGAMDEFYSGPVGDEAGVVDENTGIGNSFSRLGDPLFYPQSSQIIPPPGPLTHEHPTQTQRAKTPLFLPSQLSQRDEQVIRESGLGVERMNREELEAMLEGDGEEVEFDFAKDMETDDGGESLDLFEDEFGPTQERDKDDRKIEGVPTTFDFFCNSYAKLSFLPVPLPPRLLNGSVNSVNGANKLVRAAIAGVVDYKYTFALNYPSEEERQTAYSECHTRSAKWVLRALLANGGVFIKLGQHMASLIVLPREWTDTMRPLQDKCDPTPYEGVEALFLSDIGKPIQGLFEDFDPVPIGVASLAQVHVGTHKESGKKVAVKLQHPHLAEFCDIDMEMVEVTLGWIKYWFPEFEFTWLSEEMRENLPKEMDFVHEASNARRAMADFDHISTSLYIPEVISATKRVLIMEYIQGARVDDLTYLAEQGIDRNKVALELTRVFSQMVFLNGYFHADPHPGNLLIRRAPLNSRSPYNFEIVLLDHGLYFDLDPELRINYSKLWLSLIEKASPETRAARRTYAELVGNITPDLYPVFEAAITGRAAFEGTWEDQDSKAETQFKRASGMIDMLPQSMEEMEAIRDAVINREGLLISVLDVLRRVPRRVLMVLKLNDLTRSLDHALATTHSSVRIFLITAKYCMTAVWRDDRRRIQEEGLRTYGWLGSLHQMIGCWWRYARGYSSMRLLEIMMDVQASTLKSLAWLRGLRNRGLVGAHQAAAGLSIP
ncbi:Rad9-domain-containing protein [Chiua virens]|nr:Rad9-domain-containing protein [Chiua virens]